MARKATKKARKVQNRTTWDHIKDEVPLLAWLDYCIQYGVDFDSTVIDHLRTYADKEVSSDQVDSKLYSLWRNLGPSGKGTKFDDFKRSQGSPVIGISDIQREALRKCKANLAAPPPTRPDAECQRRGITPGLRTRSRTLSEPRQPASEDSSLSELSSTPDPDDCSDANARSKTVDDSEQVARSKKRRIEDFLSETAAPPPGEAPDTQLREELKTGIVPSRLIEKRNVSQGTQTTPIRHGVADDTSHPRLEKGSIHGEHRIKQLRSEVVTLAGCLHEARQERDELLHCARAAEGAADKTGMLVSLQHENVILKKQLLGSQEAREDAALWRAGSLGPSDREIETELDVIESAIADACASLHWAGLLLDRPRGEEPRAAELALSQWTRTLSGSAFGSFRMSCGDSPLSHIKMIDALRSLVAAALWALVWQQPLDEVVNADSPILDYYKKQLLARDGPEALLQINLLAYKSLTAQPHFDAHLIAGRSRTLSEHICHVLEPVLFRGSEPELPRKVDGSEAAAYVVSSDAMTPPDLLEDAVQSALQLAAKLYLADRWCRWRFAQPGCRFDARAMRVDVGQVAAVHSSSSGSVEDEPRVRLCVFPALYMSKTPKGSRPYEGSEGAGIRGQEDLRDYKLVAKGLVLV
ncbi:uncharacterized protein PG986_013887 [Apiospora aurea]|uniref:Uncharacterized protein n=1 Tax=Apiospora aurea TaxID=335848 RepID=A0ABR1PWW7_9PEZI